MNYLLQDAISAMQLGTPTGYAMMHTYTYL
jgi:hypothetical protein